MECDRLCSSEGTAVSATVLQVGALPEAAVLRLRERFALHIVADETEALGDISGLSNIRAIATTGKHPIGASLFAALPELEVVSCLGAGSEGVDSAALDARGIGLFTTSHVLAADVADVAIGMTIALLRDFAGAERFLRAGSWNTGRHRLGRSVGSAKMGILGLGAIGGMLAHRAEALGMEVGFHTRTERHDSHRRYFRRLIDMAQWCNVLALCCPGGDATRSIVDEPVLEALGPDGYLVNVSRGSVVDEAALGRMLERGAIAGAGLDVFETEPFPSETLLSTDRTLLLPHIGSATHETRERMIEAMVEVIAKRIPPE